jgi:pimeloyl-ACP methyl ester carboxylesterase
MTARRLEVEPFTLAVPEWELDDLRRRVASTRWPSAAPGTPWEQGTDLTYLRELLHHWAQEFDWRAQERKLNGFNHFRVDLDGIQVHFVHERPQHGDGIPLILTHGWPSTFTEFLPVVPLLTDPAAHGIDGPAFDLVIPSTPGYGFSERPARRLTYADVGRLWHRLMRGLGYPRYGAGGSDFGAGVATFMALEEPEALIGLHLTNLELAPYTGPGSHPLSEREQAYFAQAAHWDSTERGYMAIQSTKPQTLAYALNDSPAGLAAWIVEKWRAWSDSGGHLESRFSREFLLTMVTLFWVTQTMPTSMRDYFDNRRWQGEPLLGPDDFVHVPTGIAHFPNTFVPEGDLPREWAERLYNVTRWTATASGGHFAAAEEPDLVARDITTFFADIGIGRMSY